jgi:hypothetical protein
MALPAATEPRDGLPWLSDLDEELENSKHSPPKRSGNR